MLDENDQMLILEKDFKQKEKQTKSHLTKAKIENVYQWITFVYSKVKANSYLITNYLNKAGICETFHQEVVC